MNEKIYCRIRRVRAVFLTDAQNIREKEYEKTEIIYCIGDSITYGSGLEDEERLTKSYPAQLGIRLGPRYLINPAPIIIALISHPLVIYIIFIQFYLLLNSSHYFSFF